MVHTTCAMSGCLSSSRLNKDLRFHQFPHDEARCRIWVRACKRPDLDEKLKMKERNLRYTYLCSLHFEKKMYARFSLKKTSVPTLRLPDNVDTSEQTDTDNYLEVKTETDQPEEKIPIKRENESPVDATLAEKRIKGEETENEFDLFCSSLAFQLKRMPVDMAVRCQGKLQAIMTAERLAQFEGSTASPMPYNSEASTILIDYVKIEPE